MNEMDIRKRSGYVSPRLTAVNFRTERGYASSSLVQHLNIWASEDGIAINGQSRQVESYSVHDNWTDNVGSNHFWD